MKYRVVLVAVLVGACGDDSAGGGAAAGGEGTVGGGGSSGGEGAGGGPAGGAGGTPLPGCSPYDDPPTCDDGTHCVVVDDSLGLDGGTACIAPGSTPPYAVCGEDADCVSGSLCDRLIGTCKPVCDVDADCPDMGICVEAQTSAGLGIRGLDLCIAGCEPISGTACDDAAGPVNCVFREEEEAFDCAPAGNGPEVSSCDSHLDCETDMGCLEVNGDFVCLHWCQWDGGSEFCTNEEYPDSPIAFCLPQLPSIAVGSVEYGGCVPM